MADRYRPNRPDDGRDPFRKSDYDDPSAARQGADPHGDPLAELARLIGQDVSLGADRGRLRHEPLPPDDDPAPAWLTRPIEQHYADGYGRDERGFDDSQDGFPPRREEPRFTSRQSAYREPDPADYGDQGQDGYRDARSYDQGFPAADRYREPGHDDHGGHGYDQYARYDQQSDPYAASSYDTPSDPYHPANESAASAYAHRPHADAFPADSYDNQARVGGPRAAGAGVAGANAQTYPDQERGGYADTEPAYAGQEYEDESAAPRRRTGAIALVAVAGLAVIGTAGVFGYRAYVGGSGASKTPVIMADGGPNKVAPTGQPNEGGQSSKISYDRIGDRTQGERVVSREEQPIDVKTPPRIVLPGGPTVQVPQPPPWNVAPALPPPVNSSGTGGAPSVRGASPAAPAAAPAASSNEPRRVRTLTIRPDQQPGVDPVRPPAPVRSAGIGPTPVPAATAPSAPAPAARVGRLPSQPSPLSIAPQTQAEPPVQSRTAALPPPRAARAPAGPSGNFMVQLSSQKSQGEAEASYRALQSKYPAQLGNREPVIRRADLGSKGVYFRAQVGPFDSSERAVEFCESLKAAGGQCLVPRN